MSTQRPPSAARAPGSGALRMLLPATLVALSTAGCAATDEVRYGDVVALPAAYEASTYAVRQPLSLGEIVAALRSGRSAQELAGELEERGLFAPATSADIDLLLQSGAGEELIDAVQEASTLAGRGGVPLSPPVVAVPPVIVTTPPPVYPGYGWYPYAPYAPYHFGLWYHDVPRYRAPRYRGHRPPYQPHDRRRPETRPGWQSPRVSPTPVPDGGGALRPGSPRVLPGASPRVSPGASPRVSPGASPRAAPRGPAPGAIRDRRVTD